MNATVCIAGARYVIDTHSTCGGIEKGFTVGFIVPGSCIEGNNVPRAICKFTKYITKLLGFVCMAQYLDTTFFE